MVRAIRSIPIRCWARWRTTADRPLRMRCCPAVPQLTPATRILFHRRTTTNAVLVLFACLTAASTSVRLKRNRYRRHFLLQDHGRRQLHGQLHRRSQFRGRIGSARLSRFGLAGMCSVVFRFSSLSLKLLFEFLEIFIGEVFQIDQLIPCAFKGADDLVQLEMHCLGVTILRVLDQKYHEKCDDGRGRVDDELPRVGKVKGWTRQDPDEDSKHGGSKRPGAAEHNSGTAREKPKCIADDAKEIALALVFF